MDSGSKYRLIGVILAFSSFFFLYLASKKELWYFIPALIAFAFATILIQRGIRDTHYKKEIVEGAYLNKSIRFDYFMIPVIAITVLLFLLFIIIGLYWVAIILAFCIGFLRLFYKGKAFTDIMTWLKYRARNKK